MDGQTLHTKISLFMPNFRVDQCDEEPSTISGSSQLKTSMISFIKKVTLFSFPKIDNCSDMTQESISSNKSHFSNLSHDTLISNFLRNDLCAPL